MAVALALLGMLAAGGRAAELRTEPVTLVTASGAHRFTAEIAETPAALSRGLMFRKTLPPQRAMLFDFGRVAPVSMWMENTYVSLDMIFIGADGQVRRIAERTQPRSRAIIDSGGPVRAVLEVVAGTARRIGLKPGDRVRHRIFASGR